MHPSALADRKIFAPKYASRLLRCGVNDPHRLAENAWLRADDREAEHPNDDIPKATVLSELKTQLSLIRDDTSRIGATEQLILAVDSFGRPVKLRF